MYLCIYNYPLPPPPSITGNSAGTDIPVDGVGVVKMLSSDDGGIVYTMRVQTQ